MWEIFSINVTVSGSQVSDIFLYIIYSKDIIYSKEHKLGQIKQ